MKIESFQHNSNPLHVYCGLRRIMWKGLAIIIARLYEKTIYKTIIHRLIVAEISHIVRKKEHADMIALRRSAAEHGYFERR